MIPYIPGVAKSLNLFCFFQFWVIVQRMKSKEIACITKLILGLLLVIGLSAKIYVSKQREYYEYYLALAEIRIGSIVTKMLWNYVSSGILVIPIIILKTKKTTSRVHI